VLLPIMEPDWKIKTLLASAAKLRDANGELKQPPALTAEKLSSICRDQTLSFVIAKERLGFDAIQNTQSGRWKDWNLYDCSRVRLSLIE
jgi:hypothetical protein